MRFINRLLARIGLLAASMAGVTAYGQGNPYYWVPADGNYSDANESAWDIGFVPSVDFDEIAVISNGGVAHVTTPLFTNPGQVVLGELAGETGTLSIENGGVMTVTHLDGNTSLGGVDVGLGGAGTLNVLPGGNLSAVYITLGGEGGSVATLGGSGAGVTTVALAGGLGQVGEFGATVGAGNTFRVVGPNVNFQTLSFVLDSNATFAAGITAATHSAIKSENAPAVGGTLQLEFGNGVVPTVGNSWKLFDAPGVSGSFDNITAVGAPALPLGQIYTFSAVQDASSVYGAYGTVKVEQRLVLKVNRDTGMTSIVNGPQSVSIDGYSIGSELGALTPSTWNSLDDQNLSDWRESPVNGTNTRLSELKPTGSTTVSAGPGLNLGAAFRYPAPTEFGSDLEDLTFEYYTPSGQILEGTVIYEGTQRFNNLVLYVDPVDGAAQLVNQSPFTVNIDGYRIGSEAGSLLGGVGNWLSLDDQNIESGAWHEANPTANNLVELRPSGSTTLASGVTYDLGKVFNGNVEDLVLQYLFPGDDGFTRFGEVVYRDITTGSLLGDYNHDGAVNAADYSVWRDSLNSNVTPGAGADGDGNGVIGQGDYYVWKNNYGSSLVVAASLATSVPEPSSIVVAGCMAFVGSLVSARRRV